MNPPEWVRLPRGGHARVLYADEWGCLALWFWDDEPAWDWFDWDEIEIV